MTDGHWRWGRSWEPKPKKPPPEHGVKMKRAGTTWWGKRWIEALERMSAGFERRLARGRTYARTGRTHDFVVRAGEARARVTGSASEPYEVAIRLAPLGVATWSRAITQMASEARFAAELLAGAMPEAIDDSFKSAGASLFPKDERDIVADCSCPDVAVPCKHIAAVLFVLGEALDADPFLLFELRGRTREDVLAALREARTGATRAGEGEARGAAKPRARARKGSRSRSRAAAPERYDAWQSAPPPLDLSLEQPAVRGALLRALGAPRAWPYRAGPDALLAEPIARASELARRLATCEPPDE